jgi:alpha-amylase/alpha-mannosidase (GH57 family)
MTQTTQYYTGRGKCKQRTNQYTVVDEKTGLMAAYSYQTIIAFKGKDDVIYLRDERFSSTTSKHMSQLRWNAYPSISHTCIEDGVDSKSFLQLLEEHGIRKVFGYWGE